MEGSAKVRSLSPEEKAFREYYDDLLSDVHDPVKFAQVLFHKGVIGRDTKDSITSNEGEGQKRALLDSLQYALSQSSNKSLILLDARRAIQSIGGRTRCFDLMNNFIEGK